MNLYDQNFGSSFNPEYVDTEKCISLSKAAYETYTKITLNERRNIIAAVREKLSKNVDKIARLELDETGMGNYEDKFIKNVLAIHKTPGVESLTTDSLLYDETITLYEYVPYGIVCAIHPSNNPSATIISNAISMLSAGNAIINIPHPRCIEVSKYVTSLIEEAIYESSNIRNLIMTMPQSTNLLSEAIMNHPDVSLVVTTGGRAIHKIALKVPKRVIAGGEANPIVIVDETADIAKAARDIVNGASFDNNILCVTEKNIIVVESIEQCFIDELKRNDVYFVDNEEEMFKLEHTVLNSELKMSKAFQGKSANEILKEAGINVGRNIKLIVAKTCERHPFVTEELMMPLVPLISVPNFKKALEIGLFVEQGLGHTAIIHSQMVSRLSKASKAFKTSIFIKNGSSLSAIGLIGEGIASFTIANITGEGLTTAKDFSRKRSCTLTGSL